MPLQPFEATKKLCERSAWSLSNLELQKHLFLAQLEFLKDHPERLISVGFEAWDFGPVVPEIYRAVRRFGASPIQNIFHQIRVTPRPMEDALLFQSYEKYEHRTPGQLVALTHKKGGAWDLNYRSGKMNIMIPDRDIIREARSGMEC